MFFFIVAIELFLLRLIWRRCTSFSAASLCCLYILFMQGVYFYASFFKSGVDLDPGSFGEFYYNNNFGLFFYFCIFLYIFSSTLFLKNTEIQKNSSSHGEIDFNRYKKYIFAFLILGWIIFLVFVLNTKFDILWDNSEYLLLASADAMIFDGAVFNVLRSSFIFSQIIAGFALAISISASWRGLSISSTILAVLTTLVPFVGASRTSILAVGVLLVTLAVIDGARHKFTIFGLLIVIFTLVVCALAGRTTGAFGLSNFFEQFVWIGSDDNLVENAILNIAQGIFITMDSVYYGGDALELYKILSFSPFPSVVDGFDKINELGSVRLHEYVPMSAIGEVYNFGLIYALLFFGLIFYLFRDNAKSSFLKGGYYFSISSILIFVFFFMANAYPVRNVFRQFFLIFLISLIYNYVQRRRRIVLTQ